MNSPSDSASVISSLNAGSPVLTSGKPEDNSDSNGHSFLIDAWKQVRNRFVYTYEYVYDEPYDDLLLPIEQPERLVEITYSAPIARYFGMNWGWGPNYNTMWFAPLGTWNPNGTPLDGRRQIYYNFHVI